MPTVAIKKIPQDLHDRLLKVVFGGWKPKGGGRPTIREYLLETVGREVERDLKTMRKKGEKD
jgi:hypothetical protein